MPRRFFAKPKQIWNLADAAAPKGKFDKDKFFTACKLVAITQHTGAVSEATCRAALATPTTGPLAVKPHVASVGRTRFCACRHSLVQLCMQHRWGVWWLKGTVGESKSGRRAAAREDRTKKGGRCCNPLIAAPLCVSAQVPSLDGLGVTAPLPAFGAEATLPKAAGEFSRQLGLLRPLHAATLSLPMLD